MSKQWAKNFVGLHMTDFEMLLVKNPQLELTIHITFKTVQLGTFLGSCVIAPIVQSLSGPRTQLAFKSRMYEYGAYGSLLGLAVGPIWTMIFCHSKNQVQIYDRCYRLRFNRRQLNIDRFTAAGAAVGLAASGIPGIVFGIDAGLLLGNLYNTAFGAK
jgi:hypothetical protein